MTAFIARPPSFLCAGAPQPGCPARDLHFYRVFGAWDPPSLFNSRRRKKKIYKIINNDSKYVPILAKEIVASFINQASKENVEYNFTIDGEKKKTKANDANTIFFFDTIDDTNIDEFKKALFDEDLNDIQEGSEEEDILMKDVRDFLLKICNHPS